MDKPKASTSDKDLPSSEYEIPISDNFKLNAKKKLGSGAFGDIYYGNFTLFILNKVYIILRNQAKLNTLNFSMNQNFT
jgi:hypothetical protein